MVELNGFIYIHRSILEWEWYKSKNTFCLFLHCLLMANWEDKKWEGITIKRGQFVTSLSNLAKQTGLTVKEVRTALNHLKRTQDVASTGMSKYTIITVLNYDEYQSKDKVKGKQRASKGQTEGKQRANKGQQLNNNNNYNNNNKENKYIDSTSLEEEDEYIEGAEKLPEGFWDAVGGYDE